MPYRNPVLPGFHPDPSVCRVGEDYYCCTSSFCYLPGAPIFHSRDLATWRPVGHALAADDSIHLAGRGIAHGMWAPSLRHLDGRFWMVTTEMPDGGHLLTSSVDPAGPWAAPLRIDAPGYDPDLFRDADGRTWLVFADFEARGITLHQIDLASGRLRGEPQVIFRGWEDRHAEGPHLYRIGDWYYLLCAEGGTWTGHMATLARSRELFGPYESCPYNPVLTQRHRPLHHVQSAGHADLIEDHRGNWWYLHLATRQFGRQHFLGRETFLTPVHWDAGWPVAATVELEHAAELPLDLGERALPHEVDHFDAAELAPVWVHLRERRAERWSLSERPGHLRLRYDATPLTGATASPLFIGRRQEHVNLRFAVALAADPNGDEETGITIFQNAAYHYQLLLCTRDGRRQALWRRRIGDLVHEEHCSLPDGDLVLAIESDHAAYHAVAEVDGQRYMVGQGSPRLLSSELAGGFSGVMLALTATGPDPSRGADCDWVEYRVTQA